MADRTMTEDEYRELADGIRIAVSMTLSANVAMRGIVEGDGRLDLGPFVQGALAAVAEFTVDATAPAEREKVLADLHDFLTKFWNHAVSCQDIGPTEGTA